MENNRGLLGTLQTLRAQVQDMLDCVKLPSGAVAGDPRYSKEWVMEYRPALRYAIALLTLEGYGFDITFYLNYLEASIKIVDGVIQEPNPVLRYDGDWVDKYLPALDGAIKAVIKIERANAY